MLIFNNVGSSSAEKYSIHAGRKAGDIAANFQRQLLICPGHQFIFQVNEMAFIFFTNTNKNGKSQLKLSW